MIDSFKDLYRITLLIQPMYILNTFLVKGFSQNFSPRSGQFFVEQVRSDQPSFVWVWKISPKNTKFFSFFSFGSKKSLGWVKKVPGSKVGRPLIYCGSKVCSGGSRPISRIFSISYMMRVTHL